MKEVKFDAEQVLIIPSVPERSEHVIPYTVVESVRDVIERPAGNALSFSNVRVLEMVVAFRDLFGIEIVHMSGFPGAVYDAVFEKLTWSLERVSFDEIVADLVSAKKIASIASEQGQKERKLGESKPKRFSQFKRDGDIDTEESADDNPPAGE